MGWSHPHFVHPGGRSSACPMRGNPPNDIRLAHTGQLAQERDHTAIEKFLPHQVVAILEEILGGFVGFAIQEGSLIWRAYTLPHLNGLSDVGGGRDIEPASHLVWRNPEIAKFFSWVDWHTHLTPHLPCPISPHPPRIRCPC